MVIIRPLTVDDVEHLKAVRLRALRDAPLAFGSTYAKESQFTDADWQQRARTWTGNGSTTHLAMDGSTPCGIAAGFIDKDDAALAHLVSMWVAPTHRRQKIGQQLVAAVLKWAEASHAQTIVLNVTSANEPAMRFYEKLGFTRTGKTEPYPNDPALIEFEMARRLSSR